MKVQIKATGIELIDSIEDYVNKKVGHLEKYFRDPDSAIISVEVARTTRHHKSGDIFKAEILIRAGGKEYYALSEKNDLYAAIDDAKDEAARELVSFKEKGKTLLRKGGAKFKNLIKRLTWKNNGQ